MAKPEPTVAGGPTRWRVFARVAVFWVGYLAVLLLASGVKAMVPEPLGQFVWGTLSSVLILPMTLFLLRREGRSARQIGLDCGFASPLRFVLGIMLGLALFGANLLLVCAVTGELSFERQAGPGWGACMLVICSVFSLSCMEELGFRAYPLRTLMDGFRPWEAQAIVALAFGLNHIGFGWSLSTVLLGVLPSALLFGAAAMASGGLAVPIGLHAGLNLARWSVGAGGIWRTVASDEASERISTVASIIGVALTLLATLAFWPWYRARTRADA